MSRINRGLVAVTLPFLAGIILALLPPSASAAAAAKCPSQGTPAPGSTVSGGLEIDGYCELHDVTVTGGMVVDPTPDSMLSQAQWNDVDLFGSTVHGGIQVGAQSEVDSNVDFSTGELKPGPTTISGGVRLDHALFSFIENATIDGGLTIDGGGDASLFCQAVGVPPEFCLSNYPFCGVTINGNVWENDINSTQAFLGDPEEQFFSNANCAGNTIHGSVRMTNSNFIRSDGEPSEIEGETVTGSVILDHSTLELSGNTIGGSLLCTNGTVIHPPAPGDNVGNTVRGRDTCD
jgi:hypothetical protein